VGPRIGVAGDGLNLSGAEFSFAVAAAMLVPSVPGAVEGCPASTLLDETLPRITRSTLRFWARVSLLSLFATGWYSALEKFKQREASGRSCRVGVAPLGKIFRPVRVRQAQLLAERSQDRVPLSTSLAPRKPSALIRRTFLPAVEILSLASLLQSFRLHTGCAKRPTRPSGLNSRTCKIGSAASKIPKN
jgi:hypothetical protein